jgi:hypothetical protein
MEIRLPLRQVDFWPESPSDMANTQESLYKPRRGVKNPDATALTTIGLNADGTAGQPELQLSAVGPCLLASLLRFTLDRILDDSAV